MYVFIPHSPRILHRVPLDIIIITATSIYMRICTSCSIYYLKIKQLCTHTEVMHTAVVVNFVIQ